MNAGFVVIGDEIVIAGFEKASLGVQLAVNGTTRTYTKRLVSSIQRHASGSPGPEVITGDYRRSWHAIFEYAGSVLEAYATTDADQALRLEHGFHGVDSIGRNISQEPRPHVLPAVNEIEPQYEAALIAVVNAL